MIATIYYADKATWYALALMGIIVSIMILKSIKRSTIYRLLSKYSSYSESFLHYSLMRIWIHRIVPLLGVACLLIVLYRPQWGVLEQPIKHEGRHLLIALDISASMLAQDIQPSRLEAAKQKIRLLLTLLPSDLVGLMLFAGEAFMYCPLTTDQSSFLMFLDTVDAQTISSNTTNIQSVLDKSIAIFKEDAIKSKLLVIFTDGEDFSKSTLNKQAAAQLTIVAVGVGTKHGAPIPIIDQQGVTIGHHKNKAGKVALSCLNEQLLEQLTHASGGIYVPFSENTATDMLAIQQHVQMTEKIVIDQQHTCGQRYQDRYHYWALGAFLCFLIDWIIG